MSLKQAIAYVRSAAESDGDDEIISLCDRAERGEPQAVAAIWRCVSSLNGTSFDR